MNVKAGFPAPFTFPFPFPSPNLNPRVNGEGSAMVTAPMLGTKPKEEMHHVISPSTE
jgi:hypothetical protein